MRRFSYQQIRHLNVWNALHVTRHPRAESIKLKLFYPNTFITTSKTFKPFKIHLKGYAAELGFWQSKRVFDMTPVKNLS